MMHSTVFCLTFDLSNKNNHHLKQKIMKTSSSVLLPVISDSDLKVLSHVVKETLAVDADGPSFRRFKAVDLWKIQQRHTPAATRRKFNGRIRFI